MNRLQQDLDDLDRMIDTDATKDAIRSQVRLIGREVAALEADYAALAEQCSRLQAVQADTVAEPTLEHRRGLYFVADDTIPFCPHCWEAWHRRIHLSGPAPLFSDVERWDCHTCGMNYTAKPNDNFLARPPVIPPTKT